MDNFETPESILLVLEIADGGDLFDRILDTVVFEEAAAQRVRQIVEAMAYMHSWRRAPRPKTRKHPLCER